MCETEQIIKNNVPFRTFFFFSIDLNLYVLQGCFWCHVFTGKRSWPKSLFFKDIAKYSPFFLIRR